MRRALRDTDRRPVVPARHRPVTTSFQPVDEAQRQRWIADTTAAFLASGAAESDPADAVRRRAFRRAALDDDQVPSRQEQWNSQLIDAFDASPAERSVRADDRHDQDLPTA